MPVPPVRRRRWLSSWLRRHLPPRLCRPTHAGEGRSVKRRDDPQPLPPPAPPAPPAPPTPPAAAPTRQPSRPQLTRPSGVWGWALPHHKTANGPSKYSHGLFVPSALISPNVSTTAPSRNSSIASSPFTFTAHEVADGAKPKNSSNLSASELTYTKAPALSEPVPKLNSTPAVPPPLLALPRPYRLRSGMAHVADSSTPLGVPPGSGPSNTPVSSRHVEGGSGRESGGEGDSGGGSGDGDNGLRGCS
eukprot:scaffold20820_cov65-Phaeocystis_antarctica.AAC.2